MLACIWAKPPPGSNDSKLWTPSTGKPTQKWCPIKEGIPGEKVTNVFDVIDYRPWEHDDEDEDWDEDENEDWDEDEDEDEN